VHHVSLLKAFSSEVGTGSREENASKAELGASVPIQSELKRQTGLATAVDIVGQQRAAAASSRDRSPDHQDITSCCS
jgi:hypothetical protein